MNEESILFVDDNQTFTVRVEKHGVTFVVEGNSGESAFFLNHDRVRSITTFLAMKAEERDE